MSTILYAWELGSGLGHVAQARPILEAANEQGHSVFGALCELAGVQNILGQSVTLLQAPIQRRNPNSRFEPPCTFAHILHNMCFGDASEFPGRIAAWQSLFDLTKPDLLIADHAPSALLAAHESGLASVVMGTGFCCPPAVTPWPNWRPEAKLDAATVNHHQQQLLGAINTYLQSKSHPLLNWLPDLYQQAKETILTTFAELDHFPERSKTEYLGVWPSGLGEPASWPAGAGKRAFVYLKPQGAIPVLQQVRDLHLTALAYVPHLPQRVKQSLSEPLLRFAERPLDLQRAANECDLAILNAGHAATATILLAGKPLLLLPQFLEQRITAENVTGLGCGLAADLKNKSHIISQLHKLLILDGPARAAERFSQKYHAFDAQAALDASVERILELLR